MRKLMQKLNDGLIGLYCRSRVLMVSDESGMSKLAITLILLAVGVSLTLAVIAIIAPEILGLAEKTGILIEEAPLEDW